MNESAELLTAYRTSGSEEAFRELMKRFTNLVFATAKRRLGSDALAEDAAQVVFTRLASSPPPLKNDAEIAGWLHRTTLHVSIDLWRSESRRKNREQLATAMNETSHDAANWEEIAPVLDTAMNELGERDREALLLRFFSDKSMREVGTELGLKEDAAKMRVSRATDRLRARLAAHGVTCSLAGIALLLHERTIEAAPARLENRLQSMKLPTATGVGVAGALWYSGKHATIALLAVIGVVVCSYLYLAKSKPEQVPAAAPAQSSPNTNNNSTSERLAEIRKAKESAQNTAPSTNEIAGTLRVIDAATERGIPGAKVRAAYFYEGGRGEPYTITTDEFGAAAVPKPSGRADPGLNVFVAVPGYVPVADGIMQTNLNDTVFRLEQARTLSGRVLDESGQPVASVRLEAMRQESYSTENPNTDFQTTRVLTDSEGKWSYPFIPMNYKTVDFYLIASNYAPTEITFDLSKSDPANAVFTIREGSVVMGRVVTELGKPIEGAEVKELHDFGFRRLSAKSDEDGRFALRGVTDLDDNKVELMVQAKGYAPHLRKLTLAGRTNDIVIALEKGNLFHGRVVDEAGNPLSGVTVRTDYDSDGQTSDPYQWRTKTDKEGRFRWASAPSAPVRYWFEARGYKIIRDAKLEAGDQEHVIRLEKKRN